MLSRLLCLIVMVKVSEQSHFLADGEVDLPAWLAQVSEKYAQDAHYNIELIHSACVLAQLASEKTPTDESCLRAGLAMAEILLDFHVDAETLATTIIYPTLQYTDVSLEEVDEQLGHSVAKLARGVKRMNAMSHMRGYVQAAHQQVDNLRKMLLAMVDDVRGVLIKLAERLHMLRMASVLHESTAREIAQEVMDVYAPLANRLGMGTIKWEMEDRAFRYIQPDAYKSIAKGLRERRLDRDQYVKHIVDFLDQALKQSGLTHYKVYGRSKHIHSIYRKMTQKNRALDEIYDATAVRILVDTEQDCYSALSLVHHLWKPIATEFDDYIANPKPNGYRSLHTAVIGDKHFEVQIRTYAMHDLAELGVAAHWKYKEGTTTVKAAHERKIEWLREVLAWHQDVSSGMPAAAVQTECSDDRVYVFTPKGDIMDLPQGATSLDFAYHVHSDVGHRCRGAKVNGAIVNLTYQLKMGDQIEILAGKKSQPSRDWLNPQLGYLKSSRARAKVLQWFKEQHAEHYQADGEMLLDRELKKSQVRSLARLTSIDDLAKQFDFKKKEDFFVALGRGDLKIGQVIQKATKTADKTTSKLHITHDNINPAQSKNLYIEGVGNVLTHMANCCKPSVHDAIIGYVTVGRGISIHSQDCPNIQAMRFTQDASQENRLLQVSWGAKTSDYYPIELDLLAYDRQGLIRDITHLMSVEQINLVSFTTTVNKEAGTAHVHLIAEIDHVDRLQGLIAQLKKIANILSVERTV